MAYIYASACIWPGGKCALRWRNFSSWCRSSASRPTPISLIISRRLSSRSSFPWCGRPDPCKKRRGGKYPPLLSDHRNAKVARSHRMRTLLIERSEEHTSELQSLMRISYAVICLNTKKNETKDQDLAYTI